MKIMTTWNPQTHQISSWIKGRKVVISRNLERSRLKILMTLWQTMIWVAWPMARLRTIFMEMEQVLSKIATTIWSQPRSRRRNPKRSGGTTRISSPKLKITPSHETRWSSIEELLFIFYCLLLSFLCLSVYLSTDLLGNIWSDGL